MRGQPGFWDVDERYVRLSEAGDPLEKLNAIVPWEVFLKPLSKALKRSDGAKGGRPPYDAVLMFKVLVLQALYNLSDDQAEFQIQDRLSFMRFLGLGIAQKVPDAKTIWLFLEHLAEAGAIQNLFSRFDKHLSKAGYLAMGGQIVDATIVAAPKQRNTEDEKAATKAGEVPKAWKDKPAKLRQKDRDARWNGEVLEGQAGGAGQAAAHRHRGAGVRLQGSRLDRQALRLHQGMVGDERVGLRRRPALQRSQPVEHWIEGLG